MSIDQIISEYQPKYDDFEIKISFEETDEEEYYFQLNSKTYGYGCGTLRSETGIRNFLEMNLRKLLYR